MSVVRGIQAILIGRPEYGIGDYFDHDIKNVQDSVEIFHHQLWKGKIPDGVRWGEVAPEYTITLGELAAQIEAFRMSLPPEKDPQWQSLSRSHWVSA